MRNFGFGFLCLLFFVSMYGALRDLSVDVQRSMTFAVATSATWAFISIYSLKVISHPQTFKNQYIETLFNGSFHTINIVWISSIFRDSAAVIISGNHYAEGNFGDKTYVDWIFISLSGILISLIVFHIVFRVFLIKKSGE